MSGGKAVPRIVEVGSGPAEMWRARRESNPSLLIRRYLSRVRRCADQSASWHDRHAPVRIRSLSWEVVRVDGSQRPLFLSAGRAVPRRACLIVLRRRGTPHRPDASRPCCQANGAGSPALRRLVSLRALAAPAAVPKAVRRSSLVACMSVTNTFLRLDLHLT